MRPRPAAGRRTGVRSGSSPRPRRRRAGSPTSCAAPTSPAASRGRGWPCSPGRPAVRCPTLRRALLAAGVPIAAPPDELPLARQPAVVPLLMVLRYATRPAELDADAATALLTSPLGSADPLRMRRLRRGLLRLHAAGSAAVVLAPAPAARQATPRTRNDRQRPAAGRGPAGGRGGHPDPLAALPAARDGAAAPGRRPAGDRGRRRPRRGKRRGGALAGLAGRAGSTAGGATRAPAAGRSARPPTAISTPSSPSSTPPRASPTGCPARMSPRFTEYLAEQQLPGDSLADRAPRGEAVELLTAHASRGREWDVVAVPGVQEGTLARSAAARKPAGQRAAGRPASPGSPSPTGPRSRGSRRCWPRNGGCSTSPAPGPGTPCWSAPSRGRTSSPPASSTSSTRCPADQADRPVHRPGRSLVLAELVGELRRAVCAPDGPTQRRRAPGRALQLARLAEAGVPGAHPRRLVRRRPGVHRTRRCARPARSSPCRRRTSRRSCAARCAGCWSATAGATRARSPRSPARWCTRSSRPRRRARPPAELEAALRSAWARLDAGAPWFSRRELARVRGMLGAFDGWVRASRAEGLRLVAVEQPVQLDLGRRGRRPPRRPRAAAARPGRPAGGRRGGAARSSSTSRPGAPRSARARRPSTPSSRSTSSRPRSARSASWSSGERRRAVPGWCTSPISAPTARPRSRCSPRWTPRGSRTGSRCCTPAPRTPPGRCSWPGSGPTAIAARSVPPARPTAPVDGVPDA